MKYRVRFDIRHANSIYAGEVWVETDRYPSEGYIKEMCGAIMGEIEVTLNRVVALEQE